MSAQTTYTFATKIGFPGGIVDIEPHAIDTYLNEEDNGVMLYGIAVVRGTDAKQCKIPESTPCDFLGVTVNNLTTEHNLTGELLIKKNAAIGVMSYGKVYARLDSDAVVNAGDPAYFIIGSGLFTNSDGGEENVLVGKFESAASNGIAALRLYNAPVSNGEDVG